MRWRCAAPACRQRRLLSARVSIGPSLAAVGPLPAAVPDELALRRAAFLTNGNARELRQFATGESKHCCAVGALRAVCGPVRHRACLKQARLSQGASSRCVFTLNARPEQVHHHTSKLWPQRCMPRRMRWACPAATRLRHRCAAPLTWSPSEERSRLAGDEPRSRRGGLWQLPLAPPPKTRACRWREALGATGAFNRLVEAHLETA